MSLYKQYETDPELERQGIWIEFETFRVKLARAGGANKKFEKNLEARSRPYKRAIKADQLGNAQGKELMKEAYISSVILDWESRKDVQSEWMSGIEGPEGLDAPLLPFNKDNLRLTFTNLPDVFDFILEEAMKGSLYLKDIQEANAKN